MKKILFLLGAFMLASLFTGCSAKATMQNPFINSTTVTLSENNFVAIGGVTGYSSHCFFNTGFSDGEAIKNMFERAKLKRH